MDPETEEIIELSDKLSQAGAGYKNHIVLQATLNLCATAIVNACDTREEAEKAASELAERLTEAVSSYWSSAHPN
jgi:hypothetical protein